MAFNTDKKTALSKPDKSARGDIDAAIKSLCDLINSFEPYFTTSSCAGRIVIMRESGTHKKNEAQWLYVSHNPVDIATVLSHLDPLHNEVWFRQEGIILHVACKTCTDAFTLVSAARKAGLKRSGVISAKHYFVVEIVDTEKLELPLVVNGELVVSKDYLTLIVDIANKKLERTRKKMNTKP